MTLYGEKRPPADDRPTVQVSAVTWPDDGPEPGAAAGPGDAEGGRRRSRRFRTLLAAGVDQRRAGRRRRGAGAWAYAGDVPRGTTVLGAELGGRSRADAGRELRAELERRAATLAAPLRVTVGEQTAEIDPADVGLAVDVPATVAAAAEADAHPVSRLVGSRTVDPVVTVDADRLDAALRKVLGNQVRGMTMPAITYTAPPRRWCSRSRAWRWTRSAPPRWSAPAGWPARR